MKWLIGLLVGLVIVILVIWAISAYNKLIRTRNSFKNAFSQIDVQLTRRHDLIPNLIEVARGYLKHERETLEAVISARSSAVSAQAAATADPGEPAAMTELGGAESMLNRTLGRLFAVAESYPDLKANQNMAQLSEELTSTENRIAFARQAYNDSVMTYNNTRETFPTNMMANMFSFDPAALFEIDEPEQRETPQVSF